MPQDELELSTGGKEENRSLDLEEILLVRRHVDGIGDRLRAQGLRETELYKSCRSLAAWLTHVALCDDCWPNYYGGTNGNHEADSSARSAAEEDLG